jgi:hypothetical protein
MENLIITPKTKIFDLLMAYPSLEDVLIGMAPQFKKLKNPVLRKTVTKITNLGQAAIIGGLNVEDMVNTLRKEVGQGSIPSFEEGKVNYNTQRPGWYDAGKVVNFMDIRKMLNQGEQPVHEVLSAIKALGKGEILKITAPFLPAPLLDKTLSLGHGHWLQIVAEDAYDIYFVKND